MEPGTKFNKWTLIGPYERRESGLYWLSRCECGLEKFLSGYNLRAGTTTACRKCAQSHRVTSKEHKRNLENVRARERYQTDPDYAEKKRNRSRVWAQTNPDSNRKRVREWAASNPDKLTAYAEANKERISKRSREYALNKLYGLSVADYDELFSQQHGQCAICGSTGTKKVHAFLFVDHDHSTGAIRGLLCNSCNRAIGLLKDNADTLRKAADYIDRSKSL